MKVLIIGVAIAAAAGAAAGGAMRPVLAQAAPPMEAVAWSAGSADYADAAAVWSGNGPVPDYVVGTDYLPQTASPDPLADVVWPEMEPPQPSSPSSPTAYEDEPPPPSAYPSERGDILAGVHDAASPDEVAPEPPSA